MNYTVIVPFYNEEKNISSFNNELINNLKKIDNSKRNLEIIYVDDGSSDETFNEYPNQLSFLSYDLVGLVYYLALQNNLIIDKKIFLEKNR